MTEWTLKTIIPTQGDNEEILAPDGESILVGASEDQELLYQEGFSDWTLKTKET